MAKIKVEGLGKSSVYDLARIAFSICSSPKLGRKQCLKFVVCKAFLHDATNTYFHGGHNGYYRKGDYPDIDMNKLRLLIRKPDGESENKFKKKLYAAKRVVNFYENVANWKPSKIVKADHSTNKYVWLITGPEQWMHSPQLLSMVTLVLRFCTEHGPINFKTNKDLEKIFKDSSGSDAHYMSYCWDKLFLLMENYDEIFDGLEPKDLHTSSGVGSHSNGIARLCQFESGSDKLNERFKKIYESNIKK